MFPVSNPRVATRISSTLTLGGSGVFVGEPGARIDLYNVGKAGEANYERLSLYWTTNIALVQMQTGGTGTARSVRLGAQDGSAVQISSNGVETVVGSAGGFSSMITEATVALLVAGGIAAGTNPGVRLGNTASFSGGAGVSQIGAQISADLAQTGTAAFTALDIATTGVGGSGAQLLIKGSYGGTQKFSVDKDGSIDGAGGLALAEPAADKTAAYTVTAADHGVIFDTAAAGRTCNLPAAASVTGKIFTIRAKGANAVTIDPNGAETIEGGATGSVLANTAWMIQSDGAAWRRLM